MTPYEIPAYFKHSIKNKIIRGIGKTLEYIGNTGRTQ